MSTFLVECDAHTWERAGLAALDEAATIATCERIFAATLDGHPLVANRSLWRRFPRIRNARWSVGSRVLIGDALHTAHFSIGSGTRLALEDFDSAGPRVARAPRIGGRCAGCIRGDAPSGRRQTGGRGRRQRRLVRALRRAACGSQQWELAWQYYAAGASISSGCARCRRVLLPDTRPSVRRPAACSALRRAQLAGFGRDGSGGGTPARSGPSDLPARCFGAPPFRPHADRRAALTRRGAAAECAPIWRDAGWRCRPRRTLCARNRHAKRRAAGSIRGVRR